MHATPTHSGWVEPLPILAGQSPLAAFPPAPGSRSRCPSGADIRLSSPKRFLSERLYPHGSQSALRASLQSFVVAAPRRAQVCTQPLLVGIEQNLLAAILASTRLPPPLCSGGHSFRRVLPRFPAYLFHPHGYPSWLGPLDSFAVVALHVPGLHATPVLYGRTEPPGRLPSCARLPLKVVGLPRLSPRLSGFRRGFFILTAPDPRWASPRRFATAARDVLRSARYPCPFGLGQHLLAASIPAPGPHRVESHPQAS